MLPGMRPRPATHKYVIGPKVSPTRCAGAAAGGQRPQYVDARTCGLLPFGDRHPATISLVTQPTKQRLAAAIARRARLQLNHPRPPPPPRDRGPMLSQPADLRRPTWESLSAGVLGNRLLEGLEVRRD